ncbi:cell division transporter, ATP-binding protein FtsE [Paenibacillus sp. JCM 10914]|nr:cell division transporter, ATP-binding protein FtsE [Paenibacillus sp. JCM 10914]
MANYGLGSDEVIEMQDVWKTYPTGAHALQGVSVKIDRNEFVYVVGPSGAGKSTFMKLIYREEVPTKGQISVNGFNIGKLKQRKIRMFVEISGLFSKIIDYCRSCPLMRM